jgi:hypothetical protein
MGPAAGAGWRCAGRARAGFLGGVRAVIGAAGAAAAVRRRAGAAGPHVLTRHPVEWSAGQVRSSIKAHGQGSQRDLAALVPQEPKIAEVLPLLYLHGLSPTTSSQRWGRSSARRKEDPARLAWMTRGQFRFWLELIDGAPTAMVAGSLVPRPWTSSRSRGVGSRPSSALRSIR